MELRQAGLLQQPFRTHGKPLAVLSYASKVAALNMLADTCAHPHGLSLLQGPALSGKSTLIRSFVETLHEDCSFALINGKGLNTTNLLIAVLRQFGYELDLNSANELLGLVRVFALQQAASHKAPLLIIENAQDLNPSALRALSELAELRVRNASALKMVLVSSRSLKTIMAAKAMESLAKRVVHDFHLRPMNREETKLYLHTKLRAAGSDCPEFVFPEEICLDIWNASGGWPGIADRVALLALAAARTLPVHVTAVEHPALPLGTWSQSEVSNLQPDEIVPPAPPRLIVTNNGSVINELSMQKPRAIIGRSEYNDISIDSRFVSRHHALLVRHGTATFLMDLNSTNGTFVNSKRVSNHVLMHDDVITIGHHRVKFHDPCATIFADFDGTEFADTVIMKTMEDMRALLAQENTALLPTATENLPTIQT
ncbi:MAG: FHA domain-containing protein [Gammaproteobacteria bacterium]|nr:FHA domain-containing protein [Gammaproteobacteria bacterium]MDH5239893.1 FHA domain-containing protein [Gammaproteobacteria bacterium]MDH5261345.1 FHA domain-containing protein [Gammaproteobacteria bacterium]MDH5582326.1 FHA domain-containing protein [Gammaproteobacteria bacterium]